MNRLAVVTGGTRGIGCAIVEEMLHHGFDVFFTYERSADLAKEIEARYDGRARGFQVDSGDWQAVRAFASQVNDERPLEVLINSAGINDDQLFIGSNLERYWRSIQINLGSVMAFSHAFGEKLMQQRRGQIINISSIAAVKPKTGNGAYGASKAAIERFTKTLALEMARFNVRVNAIAPGFVQSELLDSFLAGQDRSAFLRSIPMRKVLEPCAVARTVSMLACGSIESTGSVIALGHGENING